MKPNLTGGCFIWREEDGGDAPYHIYTR